MNKKLAMLMFAIGFGAAAAPAFAVSCEYYCNRARIACVNSGNPADVCYDEFNDCVSSCG